MAVYRGTTALRYDLKAIVDESPMDLVEYQAPKILPEISVNETSATIPVLSTSAGMKLLDVKRAPNGTFKMGEWVFDGTSYNTYEYGYVEPVDNTEKKKYDDIFDIEVVAATIARSQLMLAREKRVADAVFNATTFATGLVSITHEWDDATNADPYTNVTTMHDTLFAKCGIPKALCHLLINEQVFRNVMRTDRVRADVKYTVAVDKLSMTEKASYLAEYLGIKQIDVATSFVDTSAIGIKDATFARLWSNEYALLYYPCSSVDSWKVRGLGRQPVWKKYAPDYIIESYPHEESDSVRIRVKEYRGEFINTKYGVLADNLTT